MSKKPCVLARDTDARVIAAICSATDAVLDEIEYELAQSVLADIETQCYSLPDAAHIMSEVEKAIGLGFTDDEFNHAARGVAQVLGVTPPRALQLPRGTATGLPAGQTTGWNCHGVKWPLPPCPCGAAEVGNV